MSKKKRYIAEDQLDIDKKLAQEKDDRIASQKAVKIFVGEQIAAKTNQTLKTTSPVTFDSVTTNPDHISKIAGHYFGTHHIELGLERRGKGDRNTYIDFHSADSYDAKHPSGSGDYHARIIRTTGRHGSFNFEQFGNGNINIVKHGSSSTGQLRIDQYSKGNIVIRQHNSNNNLDLYSKRDIHLIADGPNDSNRSIFLRSWGDGGRIDVNSDKNDVDFLVRAHNVGNYSDSRYLHYVGSSGVLYINSGNISKYNSNWANHVYFKVQGAISVRRIYDATIDEAHNNIRGLTRTCFHSNTLNDGSLGTSNDTIPTSKVVRDYVNKNSGSYLVDFARNEISNIGRPATTGTNKNVAAIDNNGRGYIWGDNHFYTHGSGHTNNNFCMSRLDIPTTAKVKQICTLFRDTLVLDVNGDVWHVGINTTGLRGDGTTNRGYFFQRVPFSKKISSISHPSYDTLSNHQEAAMFITTDNYAYFLGNDQYGYCSTMSPIKGRNVSTPQLLIGSNGKWFRCKQISFASNVRYSYANRWHPPGWSHVQCSTISAIGTDNRLYVWGTNNFGELGMGNTNSVYRPTLRLSTEVDEVLSVSSSSTNRTRDEYCGAHIFARKGNNIWSCGTNAISRAPLGRGNLTYSHADTRVFKAISFSNTLRNWLGNFQYMTYSDATHGRITMHLKGSNGKVTSWGDNHWNQATYSSSTGAPVYYPLYNTAQNSLGTIKKVVGNREATFYLTTTGVLFSIGGNICNGRGIPNDSRNSTWHKIAVDVRDVFQMGYGWDRQTQVYFIKNDNTVMVTGRVHRGMDMTGNNNNYSYGFNTAPYKSLVV